MLQDAALGAIGGLVGTVVMGKVASALYAREPEEKRAREEQLRKEPPFMVLAERLIEQAGLEVTDERKQRVGTALHWGYGATWGAFYGIVRRRAPALSRAWGIPFGIAFALVGDELMNSVMGLAAPPTEFPIDAHVRGLVAHVGFTVAADRTVRALETLR